MATRLKNKTSQTLVQTVIRRWHAADGTPWRELELRWPSGGKSQIVEYQATCCGTWLEERPPGAPLAERGDPTVFCRCECDRQNERFWARE